MRPAPQEAWNPLIDVVQAGGMALAFAAALTLRRSFGVIPANRGVKIHGAYRLVRHPIYAGYILSFCAYVAGNPSLWNVVVLVITVSLCLARIQREERHLSTDPAYRVYCAATRWKLLPFMF
jgi:protein-S-isoprenylcysteine O-methyltransferase Ste14